MDELWKTMDLAGDYFDQAAPLAGLHLTHDAGSEAKPTQPWPTASAAWPAGRATTMPRPMLNVRYISVLSTPAGLLHLGKDRGHRPTPGVEDGIELGG